MAEEPGTPNGGGELSTWHGANFFNYRLHRLLEEASVYGIEAEANRLMDTGPQSAIRYRALLDHSLKMIHGWLDQAKFEEMRRKLRGATIQPGIIVPAKTLEDLMEVDYFINREVKEHGLAVPAKPLPPDRMTDLE